MISCGDGHLFHVSRKPSGRHLGVLLAARQTSEPAGISLQVRRKFYIDPEAPGGQEARLICADRLWCAQFGRWAVLFLFRLQNHSLQVLLTDPAVAGVAPFGPPFSVDDLSAAPGDGGATMTARFVPLSMGPAAVLIVRDSADSSRVECWKNGMPSDGDRCWPPRSDACPPWVRTVAATRCAGEPLFVGGVVPEEALEHQFVIYRSVDHCQQEEEDERKQQTQLQKQNLDLMPDSSRGFGHPSLSDGACYLSDDAAGDRASSPNAPRQTRRWQWHSVAEGVSVVPSGVPLRVPEAIADAVVSLAVDFDGIQYYGTSQNRILCYRQRQFVGSHELPFIPRHLSVCHLQGSKALLATAADPEVVPQHQLVFLDSERSPHAITGRTVLHDDFFSLGYEQLLVLPSSLPGKADDDAPLLTRCSMLEEPARASAGLQLLEGTFKERLHQGIFQVIHQTGLLCDKQRIFQLLARRTSDNRPVSLPNSLPMYQAFSHPHPHPEPSLQDDDTSTLPLFPSSLSSSSSTLAKSPDLILSDLKVTFLSSTQLHLSFVATNISPTQPLLCLSLVLVQRPNASSHMIESQSMTASNELLPLASALLDCHVTLVPPLSGSCHFDVHLERASSPLPGASTELLLAWKFDVSPSHLLQALRSCPHFSITATSLFPELPSSSPSSSLPSIPLSDQWIFHCASTSASDLIAALRSFAPDSCFSLNSIGEDMWSLSIAGPHRAQHSALLGEFLRAQFGISLLPSPVTPSFDAQLARLLTSLKNGLQHGSDPQLDTQRSISHSSLVLLSALSPSAY